MRDPGPVQQAFGSLLKRRRLESGLTQEEIAERADLHWTYVSEIERGLKQPTVSVLLSLAEALGTTGHQLLADLETDLAAGSA